MGECLGIEWIGKEAGMQRIYRCWPLVGTDCASGWESDADALASDSKIKMLMESLLLDRNSQEKVSVLKGFSTKYLSKFNFVVFTAPKNNI